MWLMDDISEQGDSLDISFVLIIILSLVGIRHVIFFKKIPNSLKLKPAGDTFREGLKKKKKISGIFH